MQDDETLFKQAALNDDRAAFAQLVKLYRLPAINYITKIIKDDYYAEDVAQDVFAKFYFKRKSIYPVPSFQTYLFKSLKNAAIDWLRNHKKIEELNLANFDFPIKAQAETYLLEDLKKYLTNEEYTLIVLRFFFDLSFKEIAGVMQITAGNARIRYSRLKKKLRRLRK
ncbi:RNA polymerase sigma factor [Loigolactobacillus rennini]|uniref:Uncharacterized protein n=1 Tax=Loigolactobacillus rennini DSM 20253 TaxID=1423796 RepID=A0A0R2CYG0_9LACO|nr:sigma-70 family RNA polymerase sigma factor [Loigolactobacillus rennini]KRM97039.1 hypothetical protein FC24_GL001847 [Loigolactobacillus rennini DSM 20253]